MLFVDLNMSEPGDLGQVLPAAAGDNTSFFSPNDVAVLQHKAKSMRCSLNFYIYYSLHKLVRWSLEIIISA
jgi:hypothetical protein